MMKKCIVLFLFFFSLFTHASEKTLKCSVLFETDQHYLTKTAKNQLKTLLENIDLDMDDFELSLSGHTDDRGDDVYNIELSKKRTKAVEQFLVSMGIDQELISTRSFGEYQPLQPNTNQEFMQANRRVEVVLTFLLFESTEELESLLRAPTISTHTINPLERTIVKGNHGASLIIEPHSFVDADGNVVQEEVKVSLIEATSFESFIGHNLTTVSGDQMLVSDGMVKVEAKTLSGQSLDLAEDASITTAIEVDQVNEEMELFVSNSGQDWAVSSTPLQTGFQPVYPPRPVFRCVKYPLPKYERDEDARPLKPSKVPKPKSPRKPKWEDYKVERTWYNFSFYYFLNARAKKKYDKLEQQYKKRLVFYEDKMNRYGRRIKRYRSNLKKYYHDYKTWNEQCRKDSVTFHTTGTYARLKNLNDSIHAVAADRYHREMKEYKAARKQAAEDMGERMDALGMTSTNAVNTYVASMSELSWINIDRFYHMSDQDMRTITLNDPDDSPERVFIVFKNLKSMLPAVSKQDESQYVRDRFPKEEEAAVLAYKVIDGKPHVYYQSLHASQDELTIQYEPYSFKSLKKLLSEIQA